MTALQTVLIGLWYSLRRCFFSHENDMLQNHLNQYLAMRAAVHNNNFFKEKNNFY